jgi:hypothetical protein
VIHFTSLPSARQRVIRNPRMVADPATAVRRPLPPGRHALQKPHHRSAPATGRTAGLMIMAMVAVAVFTGLRFAPVEVSDLASPLPDGTTAGITAAPPAAVLGDEWPQQVTAGRDPDEQPAVRGDEVIVADEAVAGGWASIPAIQFVAVHDELVAPPAGRRHEAAPTPAARQTVRQQPAPQAAGPAPASPAASDVIPTVPVPPTAQTTVVIPRSSAATAPLVVVPANMPGSAPVQPPTSAVTPTPTSADPEGTPATPSTDAPPTTALPSTTPPTTEAPTTAPPTTEAPTTSSPLPTATTTVSPPADPATTAAPTPLAASSGDSPAAEEAADATPTSSAP